MPVLGGCSGNTLSVGRWQCMHWEGGVAIHRVEGWQCLKGDGGNT